MTMKRTGVSILITAVLFFGNGALLMAEAGSSAVNIANAAADWGVRAEVLEQQRTVAQNASADPAGQTSADAFVHNWMLEVDKSRQKFAAARQPRSPQMSTTPAGDGSLEAQQLPADQLLLLAPDAEMISSHFAKSASSIYGAIFDLQLQLGEFEAAVQTLSAFQNDRKQAAWLAANLIRQWTLVHGNTAEHQSGYFIHKIPLSMTRRTQDRNLKELAKLIGMLQNKIGSSLPSEIIATAFVGVRGHATSFKPDEIVEVFGPVSQIDPGVILTLAKTARQNLSAAGQTIAVQTNGQVDRTGEEVIDGFESIESLVEAKQQTSPGWGLSSILGLLLFDEAEIHRTKGMSAQKFGELRLKAFASLQQSADLFNAEIKQTNPINPTVEAYDLWLACALGNSDMTRVTTDGEPELAELPKIKAKLSELPEPLRTLMLRRLGGTWSNLSRIKKPEMSPMYVRSVLDILGEIPATRSLSRMQANYDDLLSDMKLVCAIDGDIHVGQNAFGLRVSLQHTSQLNEEVGGFTKLLPESNSVAAPAPWGNPGSPPGSVVRGRLDFRERFEANLRKVVGDKLSVVKVAWATADARPKALVRAGWEETPLAYVILKVTDPSVDTIPALRAELDFADRNESEMVILPVTSQPIPLEPAGLVERPWQITELVQTLNDRDAGTNTVRLEINAKGAGLIPELNRILDMSGLGDFAVDQSSDQGMQIDSFDANHLNSDGKQESAVLTERTWTVKLKRISAGAAAGGASFQFPKLVQASKNVAVKLQRYSENDVVPASSSLVISSIPETSRSFRIVIWSIFSLLVPGFVGLWIYFRKRRNLSIASPNSVVELPSTFTPFSTTVLLRGIHAKYHQSLTPSQLSELEEVTREIEATYFADDLKSAKPRPTFDFQALAKHWVERASASL